MAKDSGSNKKRSLNAKQARFVEEYLKDLNATQAASKAGYAHPEQQGHRLLKNVQVATAIAKAQESRAKRTQIDSDWVLRRLAQEAEADLADIYDDAGELLPVKEWPLIWRQGLVAGVDVVTEKAHDDSVNIVRKVKLSDRIKRLELLGKHINVQAFRDQVEHKGTINLTVSQEDAEL